MSIHVVQCASTWIADGSCIGVGPVVTADDDEPDRLWLDGEMLRVHHWVYSPAKVIRQPNGSDLDCEPWIEGYLPMENGAELTLHFYHGEVDGVSLGRRGPGGWFPLQEEDERLVTHVGCIGNECQGACLTYGIRYDFRCWWLVDILAAWRRVGVKPIEEVLTYAPPPNVNAKLVVSELDRAIRSGRAITLEEYRRMTA